MEQLDQALKDCRAAFAAAPGATHAWCCHHEQQIEELNEIPEARIQYILDNKPKSEQVVRFLNFRPVSKIAGELYASQQQAMDALNARQQQARDALNASQLPARDVLHKKEVPHNTWDGNSIFMVPKK